MTSKLLTISGALLFLSSQPAAAQTNGWLGSTAPAYARDDYRTSYVDARRAAYDNGYRDGLKRGEQAARDGRPLDVEREGDYRKAEDGYNRAYGDRGRYRDNYRGGFAQGFRDGYTRRGGSRAQYPAAYPGDSRGYGNGYGYGNGGNAGYGAFQNGVSDGYSKGLEDAQDRRSPDITRHKWYRSGDHDYDKRYGTKDAYREDYRRGFRQGYDRAFREGRRY